MSTKGKIRYARQYLTHVYDEIGRMPDEPGKGFAQMRVSDAIDELDRAYAAIPEKEPEHA